jgi:GTPase SAR1 family protein
MLILPPQLIMGRHFSEYFGTNDSDHRYRMTTENGFMDANFMDLSSTTVRTADPTLRTEFFTSTLSRAAGVVLLYDITNLKSFQHITNQAYMYVWMCKRYMGESVGVESCEFVLVGTKADILKSEPERREVDRELAEDWAQSQGIKHFELTTKVRSQVEEPVHELMRSINRAKDRNEKEREGEWLQRLHEKAKRKYQPGLEKASLKDRFKNALGKTRAEA